jgi:hypothetical protein
MNTCKRYFNLLLFYVVVNVIICVFFDSLIDFHPQHKNVILVSPCSGHGFKVNYTLIIKLKSQYLFTPLCLLLSVLLCGGRDRM